MADHVVEIDDGSFEAKVLNAEEPVLVDFWAPWCGPCRAIKPIVEDLAATFGGKFTFTKCNIDANPVTPGNYGIKAIPTLLFFKAGKVVDQITGLAPKARVEETINKIIAGEPLTPPFPMR